MARPIPRDPPVTTQTGASEATAEKRRGSATRPRPLLLRCETTALMRRSEETEEREEAIIVLVVALRCGERSDESPEGRITGRCG